MKSWIRVLSLSAALTPQLGSAALPSDPSAFPRFTDSFAEVDNYYRSQELLQTRGRSRPTNFAISIEMGLRKHLNASPMSIGGNERLFQVAPSTATPVSLLSHPMCTVSRNTLSRTVRKVPGTETTALANTLAYRFNTARVQAYYSQNPQERLHGWDTILQLYSKLMGCLAYTESLTTADQYSSDRMAKKIAPADYTRPSGVLFYHDSAQSDPASQTNLGLYQFSPDASGNVQSCLRNWNQAYPQSPLSTQLTKSQMIRILGDESQYFNAFCGVDKIVQSFYVQANSSNPARTHVSNQIFDARGRFVGLRAPQDRCVSLHFGTKSYNHFGPLQNSTGANMREVLKCTLE